MKVSITQMLSVSRLILAAGICVICIAADAPPKDSAAVAPPMPPAVNRPVDFVKDVAPIFEASCMQCHSGGTYEADLSIETRAKMIEGGASSPAIEPGNSADSLMIQLVAGQDAERIMPNKGTRLTAEQIGILRAWIDQGANWPDGYELHDSNKPRPAKLEPRNVELPVVDGLSNPIDRVLTKYFADHKITPGEVVDDRTFARRVYLDIVGLLPPTDELEAFVAETSSDKRAILVRRLLNDDHQYAVHWMSFWNDMLRNDYKGTGYIDGGRTQITRWLYNSLAKNMHYDEFVRQLVVGAPGAEGFTKGIVWRGVVNAAQTPQMQAAQGIGQVFMGVNLKCASCHDSFISQWKLTDSYGLASVYAEKSLEMERCTKPLGKTAPAKFLYPQLGEIDTSLPKDKRVARLAEIVTSKDNGRLTRTIVNRLWKRLMGRAIIEPVDEMDNPAWNQDLLDAMAWDLAQHYDVRKTIETIVLSRAYQLPAVAAAKEDEKDYVFAGPGIKRMTAEQVVDAVAAVSGVWNGKREAKLTDNAERYAQAKWIWSNKSADKGSKDVAPGTIYLRRTFDIAKEFTSAKAIVAADNEFTLFVNGKEIGKGTGWDKPATFDLVPHLEVGKNVIAAVAVNHADKPNPAGFWFYLDVPAANARKDEKPVRIVSDNSWKWSKGGPKDWSSVGFDAAKWKKAAEVANVAADPWKLGSYLPDEELVHPEEARAALCAADPLMVALGRPNREQILTARPSATTTLMALELTNGSTLDEVLKRGAKVMAEEKDIRAEDLVSRVYRKGLGRAPTEGEMATAKEIVGVNVDRTGVEDLLWVVVMLPEFQLIR